LTSPRASSSTVAPRARRFKAGGAASSLVPPLRGGRFQVARCASLAQVRTPAFFV